MALSDTFSGTADQTLLSYSANWNIWAAAGFECDGSGNARPASASVENAHGYSGFSFANDHWSEAIIAVPTAAHWVGAACRMTTGANYYAVYSDPTDLYIYEMVGGAWAQLGSSVTVSWASGDHTLRIKAEGTTLTIDYDASRTTRTDASHSTGVAGVGGYASADPGLGLVRSWSADDVGVAKRSLITRQAPFRAASW